MGVIWRWVTLFFLSGPSHMAVSLKPPSTESKTEGILRRSKQSPRPKSVLRRTNWKRIPRELWGLIKFVNSNWYKIRQCSLMGIEFFHGLVFCLESRRAVWVADCQKAHGGMGINMCLVTLLDNPVCCKFRCACTAMMRSPFDRIFYFLARGKREGHFWKSRLLVKSRKQADSWDLTLKRIHFLILNTLYTEIIVSLSLPCDLF